MTVFPDYSRRGQTLLIWREQQIDEAKMNGSPADGFLLFRLPSYRT